MLLVSILALIALNNPLAVSVWVDRDDAVYSPGENLFVYFSSNQGCYLAVYNVEQGGGVNRLFPPDGDDGWIRGGQTYQLPSQSSDYDYVVSGPEGVETIVTMASRERLPTLDDEGGDIVKRRFYHIDRYILCFKCFLYPFQVGPRFFLFLRKGYDDKPISAHLKNRFDDPIEFPT